ncbi:putative pheophorbide a oxygenase [Helianthus debilis subsp. tardiflorus]
MSFLQLYQPNQHPHPKKKPEALIKSAPRGIKVVGLDIVVWWDKNDNEWKVFDDRCERFDWFSHWYPVVPVCDLDKSAPRGIKVVGLDIVVWWDKNDNEWKVFDDRCAHRLAPLSEGRIEQWGRLQVYTMAGVLVALAHSFPKACVAVYPSTVQYGILWFWPNTDPKYRDILTKKKPPYVAELEDPSFSFQTLNRDIPYGYEFLIEKSHGPFSCSICTSRDIEDTRAQISVFFLCIPVGPGKSRFIAVVPKNNWDGLFYSRWRHHMIQNLIVDSDLHLLRIQEMNLMEVGPLNWQKACFVPTKADTNVVAYRKWLKKYAGGQLDRYWSHVVNCSSCSGAYKGFNALQISLQVFSVALVAIMAATK